MQTFANDLLTYILINDDCKLMHNDLDTVMALNATYLGSYHFQLKTGCF